MSPIRSTQAINAYKTVDVIGHTDTGDPHQLVSMLMDGALARIYDARKAMEDNAIARKGEALGQALSIVGALQGALDMEHGGDVADNLNELYDYAARRLFEANLNNDVALLDEVVGLLRELKQGWSAIPEPIRARAEPAGAPPQV